MIKGQHMGLFGNTSVCIDSVDGIPVLKTSQPVRVTPGNHEILFNIYFCTASSEYTHKLSVTYLAGHTYEARSPRKPVFGKLRFMLIDETSNQTLYETNVALNALDSTWWGFLLKGPGPTL